MSTRLFAARALLPAGWARDVAIDIDGTGVIASVGSGGAPTGAETLRGPLVPGMPNVHSHAFQRALAGRTGRGSPDRSDTFWTWRDVVYDFLDRIDADALEAVTAQAYVEMVKAGYTSVAEFHYVHHDVHGRPHADPAENAWRVVRAARTAGIALTLLPVFYAHGGFAGAPPTPRQRRLIHTPDAFARMVERLSAQRQAQGYVLGIAPHSLRAVSPRELAAVLALPDVDGPVHIHIAEQIREVEDCFAWSGLRPVEWLLAHAQVDARWCMVHATHMIERELIGVAQSGAVVGLAPTTEADLGDGTFPAEAFVAHEGRYGVGSDSNTVIDPFDELRQLEWSQRLRLRRRNVLSGDADVTVGNALWRAALAGGAQAVGRATGAIEPGARADFVVLDADDPALAEQPAEYLLDAAIFGPVRRAVRDVMVGGRWLVRDGRHHAEDAVLARYRGVLAAIDAGGNAPARGDVEAGDAGQGMGRAA
jgi:formimidoylglutamate deiminase